jgi:hypothetical protein
LMDYNKAFLSYDKISGARCQTSDTPLSQQQAAEEALRLPCTTHGRHFLFSHIHSSLPRKPHFLFQVLNSCLSG